MIPELDEGSSLRVGHGSPQLAGSATTTADTEQGHGQATHSVATHAARIATAAARANFVSAAWQEICIQTALDTQSAADGPIQLRLKK